MYELLFQFIFIDFTGINTVSTCAYHQYMQLRIKISVRHPKSLHDLWRFGAATIKIKLFMQI